MDDQNQQCVHLRGVLHDWFTPRVICLTNGTLFINSTGKNETVHLMSFETLAISVWNRNFPLYLKWHWYSGKMTSVRQINKYFLEWTSPEKYHQNLANINCYYSSINNHLSFIVMNGTIDKDNLTLYNNKHINNVTSLDQIIDIQVVRKDLGHFSYQSVHPQAIV